MKIAITGARGTVGQEAVKLCAKAGYATVQVNRTEQKNELGVSNTEMRTADAASDYAATMKAFQGCDPQPGGQGRPAPAKGAAIEIQHVVHSNNVNSAFNGFRACGELGIKKICYASSVNAIGLAYANQPLRSPYFPIDEDYPPNPTDFYALAKQEAETQAKAFVNWFPGTKIALMRIHEVAPKKEVKKEHEENWEEALLLLWGWVHPEATSRACLLAVEKADSFEGAQVFNVPAPDTTQETPSKELAKKYFPDAEIRSGLEGNKAFWTTDKAREVLGWEHTEKE